MSASSGSYSVSKLQPKFQDCLLKDTEPPSYIFVWIKIISGIVSNINSMSDEGGWELESLLDNYLERSSTQTALRPSFLQDEALLMDDEDLSHRTGDGVSLGSGDTGGRESNASEQDSSRTESVAEEASSHLDETLQRDDISPEVRAELEEIKARLRRPVQESVPTPSPSAGGRSRGRRSPSRHDHGPRRQVLTYRDLSPEAQHLDKALFNTMQTIIKGTYLQCLMGLEGRFARYTYAVIALWKHASLNSNTRRIAAMDSMSGLTYHGDPGKWKLDFLRAVREIYESRVTMEHWIMHSAFKSFDGKNQQVQGMIADDINNSQIVGSETNFDALSSRYSQFLATMGTGKHAKPVITPTTTGGKGKKCRRCGATGHTGEQCKHKETVCDHCGIKGHVKKACKRGSMTSAEAKAEVEKKRGEQNKGPPTSSKPMGSVTSAEIEQISQSLRNGTFQGMIRAFAAESDSTSPSGPSVQDEPHEGLGGGVSEDAMHRDIASHTVLSMTQDVESDDSCEGGDVLGTFIETGETSNPRLPPSILGGPVVGQMINELSQLAQDALLGIIPSEPRGNSEGRAEEGIEGNLENTGTFIIPSEPQGNSEGREGEGALTPLRFVLGTEPCIIPSEPQGNSEGRARECHNTGCDDPGSDTIPSEPRGNSEGRGSEGGLMADTSTVSGVLHGCTIPSEPQGNSEGRAIPEDIRVIADRRRQVIFDQLQLDIRRERQEVSDELLMQQLSRLSEDQLSLLEAADTQNRSSMATSPSPEHSSTANPVRNTVSQSRRIVLSLCDGIGGAAKALQAAFPEGTGIDAYIAVEKNKRTRDIAQIINPMADGFPGITHGLNGKHDIFKITEDDIKSLGENNIELHAHSPQCNDHSKFRLLPDRPGYRGPKRTSADPRPGLDGKYGKTIRQCIKIAGWIQKYNPASKFFFENVDFSDMPSDWEEVCNALGVPHVVDAHDHSCTRRTRAYWTNLTLPDGFKDGYDHVDPNSVMDPGRRVQKHMSNGKWYCKTIGASWDGDPNNPTASTDKPVWVFEEGVVDRQHLRPEEAERLMGYQTGATAGPGITAIDRLRCIGAGWDIRVTSMFLRHLRSDELLQQAKIHYMQLEESCTPEQWSKGFKLHMLQQADPDEYSAIISLINAEKGANEAAKLISLTQYYRNCIFLAEQQDSIILDSGAGRHIDNRTKIIDPEYRMRLTGFTGEESWTSGSGYLPLELHDFESSTDFQIDIEDVDHLDNAAASLLSMGKLLRKGWKFNLELNDLKAVTPNGEIVQLKLSVDDVLRLPHKVRQGKDAEQLPINAVRAINREGATWEFLHRLLNHASSDKIHRTLAVTKGFKQPDKPLQSQFCEGCALGNARSRGLHQHTCVHTCYMVQDSEDPVDPDPEPSSDSFESFGGDSPGDSTDSDEEVALINVQEALLDDSEDEDPDSIDIRDAYDHGRISLPRFTAKEAGRTATAAPPRFDLLQIKPYEVMFGDEKEYDYPQRGGFKSAFVLQDLKSDAWFVENVYDKKSHGEAFEKIMIKNGVHLLEYPRTIYTDGCGSMVHVCDTAVRIGINHISIPPREQSLNEAERIADRAWAAARVHIVSTDAQEDHFALAVSMVCYMKMRMATTASRNWLTPYQIIKGYQPSIAHCMPFFTQAQVKVPKEKRSWLKTKGLGHLRAEPGNLVGFQDMWGTTYKVLLDGNRMVCSRNVTFGLDRYLGSGGDKQDVADVAAELLEQRLRDQLRSKQAKKSSGQAIQTDSSQLKDPFKNMDGKPSPVPDEGNLPSPEQKGKPDGSEEVYDNPLASLPLIDSPDQSDPGDVTFLDTPDRPLPSGMSAEGITFELPEVVIDEIDTPPSEIQGPQRRVRNKTVHFEPHSALTDVTRDLQHHNRRVNYLTHLECILRVDHNVEVFNAGLNEVVERLREDNDQGTACIMAATLGQNAQKDMNWKNALASDNRDKVIAAYEKELNSLLSTILTEMSPEDKDWEVAIEQATPGRWILDVKRSGAWKVRGVKQGFREDKVMSDGPDFNYHANVVKFVTVRLILARRRAGCIIAIIDVSTAFLQSHPYPAGKVKYISFKNPLTGKWVYFRQSGPIYGEASAPVRWEDTIAPWLEDQGFTRGSNEPCLFHHQERDLVLLLYVDDILADGEPADVEWFFQTLAERFNCKDPEYLTMESGLDYLGMMLSMDSDNIYMDMEKYIDNACATIGVTVKGKTPEVPMTSPIDAESSEKCTPQQVREFLTALGMLGWLANTVRMDVAYAYSRIAQHSASPTVAALKAVRGVFAYLLATKSKAITIPLATVDREVFDYADQPTQSKSFRFCSDTDHAGNAEVQNRRRSQNGVCGLYDTVPFLWYSKASSVAFASERIGEAHADISSASVEIYGAGNATMEIMGVSYIAEEAGIEFEFPFTLELDNQAAIIFCEGSASKTRLKHIDTRQQWVQMLRDKNLVVMDKVPTDSNLADLFTKILPKPTFVKLRDQLLKDRPSKSS